MRRRGIVLHDYIINPRLTPLGIVGDGGVFVVVVVRGGGDDVPGVQEAGEEAEEAQGEVYEGVGGAEAALDPDGEGGEEDGDEAEEDVGGAHCWEGGVVAGVLC